MAEAVLYSDEIGSRLIAASVAGPISPSTGPRLKPRATSARWTFSVVVIDILLFIELMRAAAPTKLCAVHRISVRRAVALPCAVWLRDEMGGVYVYQQLTLHAGETIAFDCSHDCEVLFLDELGCARWKKTRSPAPALHTTRMPLTCAASHAGVWHLIVNFLDTNSADLKDREPTYAESRALHLRG